MADTLVLSQGHEVSTSARTQLAKSTTRLSEISFEIDTLEQLLEELRKEEENLVAALHQSNNETTPIHKLSDDLLREIFAWCLPATHPDCDVTKAPLLLCHICKRWRALATDYALLWQRFRHYGSEKVKDLVRDQELLAAWLSRCKTSAIKAQFINTGTVRLSEEGMGRYPPTTLADHGHFINVLSAVAQSRLHNVTHLTLNCIPISVILAFPPSSLPNLQALVLKTSFSDTIDWSRNPPLSAFLDCPSLRKVAISGPCFENVELGVIRLPWEQLTDLLYERDIHVTLMDYILSTSVSLKSFFVELGVQSAGGKPEWIFQPPNKEKRNHLGLSSLTISGWGTQDGDMLYPNFFRVWRTPNVVHLRLTGGCCKTDSGTWYRGDKKDFLDSIEGMSKLSRLSLCFNELDCDDARTLFRVTPNITHLELELMYCYSDVLELLTWVPGRRYLPNLKVLTFDVGWEPLLTCLSDHNMDEGAIVDAGRLFDCVKSRLPSNEQNEQRLERAVFVGYEEWQLHQDKPFIKCLRPLTKLGLVVETKLIPLEVDVQDSIWIYRDEDYRDWPEAREMFIDYIGRDFSAYLKGREAGSDDSDSSWETE